MWQARASCLRLLLHLRRAAASRTFWTAGNSRPMRMAMMAITTSSSISVKPRQRRKTLGIGMTETSERKEYDSSFAGETNEKPVDDSTLSHGGGRFPRTATATIREL